MSVNQNSTPIEGVVLPALWESVRTTYEAGSYSHAVVDSIRYMSEVLRSQSGVDGDGVTLVGQALGGDTPRLRLNKLQSQSDKDEQKGFEQLLRGIYVGLRNPRVHDQGRKPDARQQADTLILFVDFVCRKLLEGQLPFTVNGFQSAVFDENFVRTSAYAKLLVTEVPPNKRLETTVSLFHSTAAGDNVRVVSPELVATFTDEDRRSFYSVVSAELRSSNDTDALFRAFQMVTPDAWPELHDISRARTEARVVKHLQAASVSPTGRINTDGALITWTRNHFKAFAKTTRHQLLAALREKLVSHESGERRFVVKWMISSLAELAENELSKRAIARALVKAAADDEELADDLTGEMVVLSDWKDLLLQEFESLRERRPELLKAIEESDEVPF